jgi:putative colanic acid biosynthesis UDP-glucose lipid carrier transferase
VSTGSQQLRERWTPFLDGLAIVTSACAAHRICGLAFGEAAQAASLIGALLFVLMCQAVGTGRRGWPATPGGEVAAVFASWGLSLPIQGLIKVASGRGLWPGSLTWWAWVVLTPAVVALVRMLARAAHDATSQRSGTHRRIAIAGFNRLGLQVARGLETDHAGNGLRLVGFYDDRVAVRSQGDAGSCQAAPTMPCVGRFAQLVAAARGGEIDVVLITMPMRAENRIRDLLDALADTTASTYVVPDIFVFELLHCRWTSVGGLLAVSIFETPFFGAAGTLKRAMDLTLGVTALIFAAIPMLMIALAVRLTSPGPVLFVQRRYGLDGREILVRKFRTMSVCEDGPVVSQATRQDPRVTALGRILRRTSLDELPQLFNVIGGSMSLVGPRPHATVHNELYRGKIRAYMMRHKVKPGVTGLAQVEGCRGETDTLDKMRRRVEFDHRYIREWSVGLDLRILLKTLRVAWSQPEAY